MFSKISYLNNEFLPLFFNLLITFNRPKAVFFFKFFKKKIKNELNILIFLKKKGLIFKKGRQFYVSIKNKHMSMEHTHPPHHYILGADKFYTVSKFKKKLLEIVEKK